MSTAAVKNGGNLQDYVQLQKSLLCLVVMFNRRRAGEASKIMLEDYERSKKVNNLVNPSEYRLKSLRKLYLNSSTEWRLMGSKGDMSQ